MVNVIIQLIISIFGRFSKTIWHFYMFTPKETVWLMWPFPYCYQIGSPQSDNTLTALSNSSFPSQTNWYVYWYIYYQNFETLSLVQWNLLYMIADNVVKYIPTVISLTLLQIDHTTTVLGAVLELNQKN